MIKLRDYQETAIKDLKSKANRLLDLQGSKTIVFDAPTGSGKTLMVAAFLKSFVESRSDNKTFSFIWTAPRKLHTQSKDKLENYYKDTKALKCSYFEGLSDKKISENEILFLNWESINQEDNIYIRENEQELNLSNILQNTFDEDRVIILIIDESHHAATTEISQGLIQMFNPKITVEVSATPLAHGDEKITVYREDVIAEEMIKKQISINPDAENIVTGQTKDGLKVESTGQETTNELLINMALAKHEQLARYFADSGININPLMLIQLPDRRANMDMKEEVVGILKEKYNITAENEKLAIYLSEGSVNRENIEKNDSPVEVMIFKQAIALGWDCPRAHMLVLFRDWRSIVFTIQTIGRIMRMPELKHYQIEDLNTGYIYTNLADIAIHKEIADGYTTIHHSTRKKIYENVSLLSVHSKRQRERTRLNPSFIKHFLVSAEELNLKNEITIAVDEIAQQLITDGVIKNIDEETEHIQDSSVFDLAQNEEDIQKMFDSFIIDNLHPYYPEQRSIGRLKTSIYNFFKKEFSNKLEYNGIKAQMVVLAKDNQQHFIDVINLAKEKYAEEVIKRSKEIEADEKWEVPLSINYSEHYSKRQVKKTIMEPFFERNDTSESERKFVDYLKNKRDVIWWFKNGERDRTFFAIPYQDGEDVKPFYVDWIVKYKNGRIGLFDTKGGIYAETAKARAEGLAKYITEEKEKGKNLFGGIVIEKDNSWYLNDNDVYEYDKNDLTGTGWKILS